MDEEVAQFYMVDGVITVVDAVNGPRTLDEQAPAQAQVGFADRILLSKVDLFRLPSLKIYLIDFIT